MNSRVHPKYKTKYRVTNWAEYDQALVQRGDISVWFSPGLRKPGTQSLRDDAERHRSTRTLQSKPLSPCAWSSACRCVKRKAS